MAGEGPAAGAARLRDVADAIVAHTSMGIWAVDAQDITLFVNERMAEMLRRDPAEMVGRPVYDFLDGARAEHAREIEIKRSDGSMLTAVVDWMPLQEGGVYAGAVALVADMTRRKTIEQQARLLAALVQSSSDAIVACSLDGVIESWNPAAEALFGWPAADVLGRPLGVILSPSEGVIRALYMAAEGRLVGPLEAEVVARDGARVPTELTASPVTDDSGQVTRVAATLRDIRERRESERLILEAERARTAVEQVGQTGRFEWRLDSGEVIWSAEMWRIHGRKPDGPPHTDYMEQVHPADRDRLRSVGFVSAAEGTPLDARYRIITPGGEVRWVHAHAAPTGDDDRRLVGTLRDVTEIVIAEEEARRAYAELSRQALHDPLTGLPNRTLVLDRLSVAMAHTERNRCSVGLMVCDIDSFALVNEELGHAFADELLKAVAHRLAAIMRAGDTVGRLVGDVFAVVCENIDHSQSAVDTLAARVVDAFGVPFSVGDEEVFLVASVGAAWTPQAEPAERLLERSFAALRTAKERERGSFVVAQPGGAVPYTGRGRLALRQSLREAVGTDQLRVVYQPIVSLQNDRPYALEALLRWDHPGLGPVSPLEFIPVAEDTGLILPIGEWVIQEACVTLARIDPDLSIAVNLSARQLIQQDLPTIVATALFDHHIEPRRLILELTESILVEESEEVEVTLAELKKIGVRLALDDFGTGYSALGYLKRFPFDIVKVDRSFVRGLGQDSGDQAIVGAVMGMATALGMEVVAEGIETEAQAECAAELGAQYGQGFYFARPGPAEESAEVRRTPRA